VKIFHVLKYVFPSAGNACAVVDLACTQADAGHDVIVCGSANTLEPLLQSHGVRCITLPGLANARRLPSALAALYRVLRHERPDIVHAHMMQSSLLAALLRPLLGYRMVTTVHNEFQRTAILMRFGQRVIGVSDAVSKAMIQRGVPASRVRTVLNGSANSPRRPQPLPEPADLPHPCIMTVAGLHPRKGIPDLLEAFGVVRERYPDAHLYLVGSGPMEEEYKALGRKIGGEFVHFLGHQDDPRPLLRAVDVFVLASHAEPAALVFPEAREAGCAIVATAVGGIPEMTDHGNAALLVPPKRPDALAAAILRLLDDPDLKARMKANSKANIEYFDVRRVAADTEKVYRELLLEK
jgi:glycosyltransferase involved in cell wall biosynthesis